MQERDPLQSLRATQPVLAEPEALTMQIMRELENPAVRVRSVVSVAYGDGRPAGILRGVLVGAAGFLLVLYIVLSVDDARSLSSFEARQRYSGAAELSVAEKLAREAGGMLNDHAARRYAEAGIVAGEAVRTLETLLNPRREPTRVTMEDYLLRKYPRLAAVTLQDGIDERERTILAVEGERFLRDLDLLIRKEKSNHEQ